VSVILGSHESGSKLPTPFAVLQGNGKAMRSAATWFLILAGVCIAGPYLLGVRPRTARERQYVALTIAFLAWVLLLMAALRSR
jgi:hypothetical protein